MHMTQNKTKVFLCVQKKLRRRMKIESKNDTTKWQE